MCLESTELKVDKKDGKIHIRVPADSSKDLILSPESYKDLLDWEKEINSHTIYANRLVAAGLLVSANLTSSK